LLDLLPQNKNFPAPVAVQHLDAALSTNFLSAGAQRPTVRSARRACDARSNNDPPRIGDGSHVGRSQPVAASKDLDKAPPERQRSVRETRLMPKCRYHGRFLSLRNHDSENPEYADSSDASCAQWASIAKVPMNFCANSPIAGPQPPVVRWLRAALRKSGE
jgi:hypothetical protein